MENKFYVYSGAAIRNGGFSTFSGWIVEKDYEKAKATVWLATQERYKPKAGYYNHQIEVQEYDFDSITQVMNTWEG